MSVNQNFCGFLKNKVDVGGTIRYNMFCQLRQRLDDADVAQLVEQRIRNAQVVGSTPIISSSEIKPSEVFGGLFFISICL